MKPVDQTLFGDKVGNCFAACVASMLEVSIDEVEISPSDDWLSTTQKYLAGKGLFYLEIRIDVSVAYPLYEMHGVPALLMGKSPRGEFNHCVVGKLKMDQGYPAFEMVHDPHPDRTFLDGRPKGIGFIVPFNPARF